MAGFLLSELEKRMTEIQALEVGQEWEWNGVRYSVVVINKTHLLLRSLKTDKTIWKLQSKFRKQFTFVK